MKTTPATASQRTSYRPAGLKQLRLNQGLTQVELAALVGCQQSTISQLETGTRCGTVDLLKRAADALHCTVDDLLAPV